MQLHYFNIVAETYISDLGLVIRKYKSQGLVAKYFFQKFRGTYCKQTIIIIIIIRLLVRYLLGR